MAKQFIELNSSGQFTAPVGAKTTVINTGESTASVSKSGALDELNGLSARAKEAVQYALYGLEPGAQKSLAAGTYQVNFSGYFGTGLVAIIETTDPQQ
ncbi:hypothetical protein GCM10028807_49950 [Spirosoma daeguense]